MEKFTWRSIMGGKDYLLTQGEYGIERKRSSNDYSLSCEYLIDNTRIAHAQTKDNKKAILEYFYDNVGDWEYQIDIKIVNVSHLGYHIYMIDMPCHKYRERGGIVALTYVHKDDAKDYLVRRVR